MRALARHGPADRHQRRRAEEADVDAGQGEAGALAGDRQVAGGDELASRRRGDALDRRDDRLRQRDDRLHERGAARHDLLVEGAAAVGIVAVRLDLPEVVAGAQRRPFAGEHDDARPVVLGDVGEGDDQRVDHREAERVAVLRRGQRQGDDAGVVLAAEELRGEGRRGRRSSWRAFLFAQGAAPSICRSEADVDMQSASEFCDPGRECRSDTRNPVYPCEQRKRTEVSGGARQGEKILCASRL